MYSGLNIGSLPFEGELLDKYQDHGNRISSSSNPSNSKDSRKKANSQILTNSGDPVNMALPKLQRETNSASTPASKLLSDYTIAEVENNSNRIDESVLKEDFYNALDEKCQKEHHQNFEELSKQSLKDALEFQGRVYQDFTKEKAKLSEKQLVSTDRYGYPCIVTNCSFTSISRASVQVHLFKHTKVSQHYCEQCFPNIFFARDKTELNRHIGYHHSTDSTLSKYGAKRICPPDQNTMNSFSECNVSQVSDPCSLLNAAKRAKTDP